MVAHCSSALESRQRRFAEILEFWGLQVPDVDAIRWYSRTAWPKRLQPYLICQCIICTVCFTCCEVSQWQFPLSTNWILWCREWRLHALWKGRFCSSVASMGNWNIVIDAPLPIIAIWCLPTELSAWWHWLTVTSPPKRWTPPDWLFASVMEDAPHWLSLLLEILWFYPAVFSWGTSDLGSNFGECVPSCRKNHSLGSVFPHVQYCRIDDGDDAVRYYHHFCYFCFDFGLGIVFHPFSSMAVE